MNDPRIEALQAADEALKEYRDRRIERETVLDLAEDRAYLESLSSDSRRMNIRHALWLMEKHYDDEESMMALLVSLDLEKLKPEVFITVMRDSFRFLRGHPEWSPTLERAIVLLGDEYLDGL